MNTRGLVEFIALNIGYDHGILSPPIFTMLVLMALVTTGMSGPLLGLSDHLRARHGLAGQTYLSAPAAPKITLRRPVFACRSPEQPLPLS